MSSPALRQFLITFDNPKATYFGGQIVSGNIRLSLLRPTHTRGLELRFRGEAKVRWELEKQEKDESGNYVLQAEEYSSHELYFESKFYVLGGPTSEMLLQPGDHMYNFTMQLPSVLPSSFEGKFGYIRYTLLASLIQDLHGNFLSKSAFTVLCPLDLNLEPNVKEPVMLSDDKFLCCCCCKSGPITCSFAIPTTGFVPGQAISFSLEVDNGSDGTVSSIFVSLCKAVTFTVSSPKLDKKVDTHKVVQMVLNGVAAHDTYSWTERLEVPCLPPSYLRNCTTIDIRYFLEVEVKISGPHKNMLMEIPIVIGTVPIVTAAPSNSGGGQIGFVPAPSAPVLYEDCMLGPVNIREFGDGQDMQGNFNFVPKYPVYRTQIHC